MTLDEIRKAPIQELERLAADVRQKIRPTCLKNGGHLGASLGTVELTIALHSEFCSPEDALIWDVGHQAYAHKLLTGRWDSFDTLRQENGISGFLSRAESPHDIFGAGHSSTSLSVALALAWSNRRKNLPNWSVAIVGDGGLTAGIAQEALNQLSMKDLGPLLIIINDNRMSISENVGGLSQILAGGRAREFFNLYGAEYIGPIDGHDLSALKGTLQKIRGKNSVESAPNQKPPVVLHVITQKGKGYSPAEENPAGFHGVGPLRAKVPGATAPPKKTWSDVFGETLSDYAAKNDRIVAITAAMTDGTGLTQFAERFRDRFFDVGIAEPHAVEFAAGLATQGWRPVVAIYSTFMQRAIDPMIHDVALQKLPVVFALDRAGLVGADGPTHHGSFDLAYLQMIPGLNVYAPEFSSDMKAILGVALHSLGPSAIRYPRGEAPEAHREPLQNGLRFHQRARSPELIAIGVGVAGSRVAEAARLVDPQAQSITALTCVHVKPFPKPLIQMLMDHPEALVLSVEDGSVLGGFGKNLGADCVMGYGDLFYAHGSPPSLESRAGVSQQQIAQAMK